MSLEELRAECGKLQTVDNPSPEALLVHAMHVLEELQEEVERLNQILGRIVEGDCDSTLNIRFGTDAFAAAREYLLRKQEEDHGQ
jgi:hypothetical protein